MLWTAKGPHSFIGRTPASISLGFVCELVHMNCNFPRLTSVGTCDTDFTSELTGGLQRELIIPQTSYNGITCSRSIRWLLYGLARGLCLLQTLIHNHNRIHLHSHITPVHRHVLSRTRDRRPLLIDPYRKFENTQAAETDGTV